MADETAFLETTGLLRRGSVTNTAMLLLGRADRAGLLRPAGAGPIRWTLLDARNRPVASEDFGPPLLFAARRVVERVRGSETRCAARRSPALADTENYDDEVLREALINAIAHHDYRGARSIRVTEHTNRVVISNAGDFSHAGEDLFDTPMTYRNTGLARAMREFGLIEAVGGGIRRMFDRQQSRRLPLPSYARSEPDRVRLAIARGAVDDC